VTCLIDTNVVLRWVQRHAPEHLQADSFRDLDFVRGLGRNRRFVGESFYHGCVWQLGGWDATGL